MTGAALVNRGLPGPCSKKKPNHLARFDKALLLAMLPFDAFAVFPVMIAVPLAALMPDTFAALMVALVNPCDTVLDSGNSHGSFHCRNWDGCHRE